MSPVQPRDAATVVLLRDSRRGLQTCLLQRSTDLVFAGGAHVFPGGVVEPSDAASGEAVTGISDVAASEQVGVPAGGLCFWSAAVRECLEESGVLPGLDALRTPGGRRIRAARQRLQSGEHTFAEVLDDLGAVIDGSRLRCVSRWITSVGSPRRYDTRFFLAVMPEGQSVQADGSEIVDHRWTTPREALECHLSGEIQLIFPTVRTLSALSTFANVAETFEGLDFGNPAEPLLPEVVEEQHGTYLVLPGDPEGTGGVYDWLTGSPVAGGPVSPATAVDRA